MPLPSHFKKKSPLSSSHVKVLLPKSEAFYFWKHSKPVSSYPPPLFFFREALICKAFPPLFALNGFFFFFGEYVLPFLSWGGGVTRVL